MWVGTRGLQILPPNSSRAAAAGRRAGENACIRRGHERRATRTWQRVAHERSGDKRGWQAPRRIRCPRLARGGHVARYPGVDDMLPPVPQRGSNRPGAPDGGYVGIRGRFSTCRWGQHGDAVSSPSRLRFDRRHRAFGGARLPRAVRRRRGDRAYLVDGAHQEPDRAGGAGVSGQSRRGALHPGQRERCARRWSTAAASCRCRPSRCSTR